MKEVTANFKVFKSQERNKLNQVSSKCICRISSIEVNFTTFDILWFICNFNFYV